MARTSVPSHDLNPSIDEALDEHYLVEQEIREIVCVNAGAGASACEGTQDNLTDAIVQRRERIVAPLRAEAERVAQAQLSDVPCRVTSPHGVSTCLTHVELLDAGREPRAVLRYRFDAEPGHLELKQQLSTMAAPVFGTPGEMFGTPIARYDVTTRSETKGNETHTRYELARAHVTPLDDTSRMLGRGISIQTGTRFEVVTDPRGFVLASGYEGPEGAGGAHLALDRLAARFHAFTVPLPEKPVGVGAIWLVTTIVGDERAVMAYQLTSYGDAYIDFLTWGWNRRSPPGPAEFLDRLVSIGVFGDDRPLPVMEALIDGGGRIKLTSPMRVDGLRSKAQPNLADTKAFYINGSDDLTRDTQAYEWPDEVFP